MDGLWNDMEGTLTLIQNRTGVPPTPTGTIPSFCQPPERPMPKFSSSTKPC